MGAKSKNTTKNAKKAAVELKSPKTPKADKVATQAKKIVKEERQDRFKIGLDPALVQKATEALIKYHEKTASESKSLLGNDQPIHVQFTLLRAPVDPSPKPIRVMIPHPLFHLQQQSSSDGENTLEEPEVCLIVKEESKPWCQEMIERFPDHLGCIKKVLGLQSLRTKHGRYEQQRALLHKYNFFLADDRILPMLSKALGKSFYNAKKLPIPIDLTRKEALPFAIQNALSATYMSISTGTCIMIRAGTTAMTPTQLTENIVQIAAGAVPKMPQKWANVQNIAIKTPSSVALPVYNKTPEVLREIAALAGIVQTIDEVEQESKEDEKETTTTSNSNTANKKDSKQAEKKRETQSPLLRALKKQKQEKEKSNLSSENATKTQATSKGNQKEKKRTSPLEDSTQKVDETQHSAKKSKKETVKKESADKIETPKSNKSDSKKSNHDLKSPNPTTKSTPVVKSETTKSPKDGNETKKTNNGVEPTQSKKGATSPKTSQKSSDKNVKQEEGVVNTNFIAAKKFQGSKKGYVFKMGKEGLGYYVDVKPVVDHMAMDALTRAVKNKGNQGGQKKGKKQGKRRF